MTEEQQNGKMGNLQTKQGNSIRQYTNKQCTVHMRFLFMMLVSLFLWLVSLATGGRKAALQRMNSCLFTLVSWEEALITSSHDSSHCTLFTKQSSGSSQAH